MNILIKGFRYYDETEFNFEKDKIHLVDGRSGTGKSTIFQAITWCLYGKDKSVHNHYYSSTDRMWVQVTIGDVKVYRQRNPCLLQVLISGVQIILESTPAQDYINKKFGNINLWYSSSYIEQKSYNHFLETNSAGKTELLNIMAFHDDNPKDYINKVIDAIKSTEINLQVAQGIYQSDAQKYSDLISKYTISRSDYKSKDEINLLQKEILHLQNSIQTDTSQLKNEECSLMKHKTLVNQKDSIQSTLSTLPYIDSDTLKEKYDQYTRYQQREELSLSLSKAEANLNLHTMTQPKQPESASGVPPKFTNDDLCKLQEQHHKYNNNLNTCTRINVEYSTESIQKEIKYLENYLSYQSSFTINNSIKSKYNQLSALKQEFDSTPIPPSKIDMDKPIVPQFPQISKPSQSTLREPQLISKELVSRQFTIQDSINSRLREIEKSRICMECPECTTKLKLVNGKLDLYATFIADEEEYNNLKQQLMDIQQQIEMKYQEEVDTYNKNLNLYREHLLKQDLETKKYNSEIQRYNHEMNKYDAEMRKYNTEISNLELINNKYILLQRSISALESELQLSNTVDIPDNIKELTQQQIATVNQKLGILKSIQIIDNADPQYAEQCIQWWNYKDLLNRLIMQKEECQKKLDEYGEANFIDINVLTNESLILGKRQSLSDQLSKIDKELLLYVDNSQNISKLSTSINSSISTIRSYQDIINKAAIASMVNDSYEQLLSKFNSMNTLQTRLANLNTLKKEEIDTECESLIGVVDRINSFIEQNSDFIFDDPIKIKVSLYKTMKVSGVDKPIVNLHILYKGGEFTDIKSLSGGEKEKVNLLITLAIHTICGSNLLILDESLVSLDTSSKDACHKLIKRTVSDDGIVIVVSHEACDGLYEAIIQV